MELNQYQALAMASAIYPNKGSNIIYPTLGLCGESGEVAEKIKKVIRDNNGIISDETKQLLSKELGDVLWYVSAISNELGIDLNTVAETNISKLSNRVKNNTLHGSGDNR